MPIEEIEVPDEVMNECFSMYSDVLTYTKKQNLAEIIRHAFISAKRLNEEKDEED